MGCNCGGGTPDEYYLITLADQTHTLARTETGARLAITMGGGGIWRKVTPTEATELVGQGVPLK